MPKIQLIINTVNLMGKVIELGSAANKQFYGAATNRYLQSINQPQIYGAQFQSMEDDS